MEEPLVEEIDIDVAAVIPAHLKGFQEVRVDSVNASELCVTIDGERLKGRIGDAI
jgi:hypothetical protein